MIFLISIVIYLALVIVATRYQVTYYLHVMKYLIDANKTHINKTHIYGRSDAYNAFRHSKIFEAVMTVGVTLAILSLFTALFAIMFPPLWAIVIFLLIVTLSHFGVVMLVSEKSDFYYEPTVELEKLTNLNLQHLSHKELKNLSLLLDKFKGCEDFLKIYIGRVHIKNPDYPEDELWTIKNIGDKKNLILLNENLTDTLKVSFPFIDLLRRDPEFVTYFSNQIATIHFDVFTRILSLNDEYLFYNFATKVISAYLKVNKEKYATLINNEIERVHHEEELKALNDKIAHEEKEARDEEIENLKDKIDQL